MEEADGSSHRRWLPGKHAGVLHADPHCLVPQRCRAIDGYALAGSWCASVPLLRVCGPCSQVPPPESTDDAVLAASEGEEEHVGEPLVGFHPHPPPRTAARDDPTIHLGWKRALLAQRDRGEIACAMPRRLAHPARRESAKARNARGGGGAETAPKHRGKKERDDHKKRPGWVPH